MNTPYNPRDVQTPDGRVLIHQEPPDPAREIAFRQAALEMACRLALHHLKHDRQEMARKVLRAAVEAQ